MCPLRPYFALMRCGAIVGHLDIDNRRMARLRAQNDEK